MSEVAAVSDIDDGGTVGPDLRGISNIPMLVLWLNRHGEETHTVICGLGCLLEHAQKGDGCRVLAASLAPDTFSRMITRFPDHEQIALLVVSVVRRLLDCNLTRDSVLATTELPRVCLSVGRVFSHSLSHVDVVTHCLRQCCVSPASRRLLITEVSFQFLRSCCQRFHSSRTLVRSIIKYCNWVAPEPADLRALFKFGAVGLCVKVMRRHLSAPEILRPAVQFIARCCNACPQAVTYLLDKGAVGLLVRACMAMPGDDELLVLGLQLIREMSRTQEGWRQLEAVPGGWQALCVGSVEGDALVHDLQGAFQNKGWCVGEMAFLPLKERQIIDDAAISGLRARTRVNWSVRTLRDYMKTSAGQFSLEINHERETAHFDLLSSLDLLPEPDEGREAWYLRLYKHEKDNGVRVEDMVQTALDIGRRERGEQEREREYVKPIFVLGELITAEGLDAQDLTAEERLQRVNVDDLDDDE